MRKTLRVLPEAEGEIRAAARWYEAKQPRLGEAFIEELDEAFKAILDAPQAWPIWRATFPFRRCTLQRFPYVIFYCIEPQDIEIVAVAHAKRKPDYWRGRVRL